MSRHLSAQELAESFVGQPLNAELVSHLRECPECRTELDRFGEAVFEFRGAIRDAADARVESAAGIGLHQRRWQETAARGRWQWALATAVVIVAGLLPLVALDSRFHPDPQETSAEVDPSVLMDSINLHLSRDLPAPMEPIMVRESGGIQ